MKRQMTDRLTCPKCGSREFQQERSMIYDEFVAVQFAPNGDIEEEVIESSECCGEDSAGAYQCKHCGWEVVNENGEPITNADEIVAKFKLPSKQDADGDDEPDVIYEE